jgi:hypothetical protein
MKHSISIFTLFFLLPTIAFADINQMLIDRLGLARVDRYLYINHISYNGHDSSDFCSILERPNNNLSIMCTSLYNVPNASAGDFCKIFFKYEYVQDELGIKSMDCWDEER